MRLALTGNPNSGKTTLYNLLTGKSEQVGNWAGVTVDKKESGLKKSLNVNEENIKIVDLPGAYSMSPFTNEESVTRDYIKNENIDVILNIVDSTNLSRSLFFTSQLLELNIPVVVALNKTDLVKKAGTEIDIKKLENLLGCTVVEITALKNNSNNGIEDLIKSCIKVKGQTQKAPFLKIKNLNNEEEVKDNDKKRYKFIDDIISKVEKRIIKSNQKTNQDKIDSILAHKWLGLPIFAFIMLGVFSLSQTYLGPFLAEILGGVVDKIYVAVEGMLGEGVSPILSSILLDGIIGGVGAVLGFLPLIMILFFAIALLEDIGYMARVAVLMDRFFKHIGLSGKSIIPMIVGTGCAIPGIMATRTIKNERERRTMAMLTPFMPCGAKLPVIALFASVFFGGSALVGTSMYFVGILLIIIGALIILKITGAKQSTTYFIMEIPEYKIPSFKRAVKSMIERGKEFVIKAGTIILVCNTLIQVMQSFDWKLQLVSEATQNTSILATISTPFAFLLVPLGFGVWQLAAAAITGFIAKENVVGTLAVLYSITNFIDTEELAVLGGESSIAKIMGITSVAALSYLMFNLFTPPCFAAIGAMNAEMENKKWLFGGVAFQFSVGYTLSFFVYQIGTLITTGSLGQGFVLGLSIVLSIFAVIGYLIRKNNVKKEEHVCQMQ